MKSILFLSIFHIFITSPILAACYSSGKDIFGNESITCDDGNNYEIQRNEILGTTDIQGSNSYTGSTWTQNIQNNILGKTMSGTDKDGNSYNCNWNSLFNKWDC